jgi:hypothetical protein
MDPALLFLPRVMSRVTNAREVQMNARIFKNTIAAAAIITVSVFAAGCGTDTIIAPDSDFSAAGQALVLPSAEQTPSASFKSGRGPAVAVLVSAEQGGTVRLGRYQLDFPPGALAEDTEITIRQSSPSSMTLELGPHGIQFAKPVVLSADVAGVELEGQSTVVGVRWFNESTGSWQPIAEQPIGATRVSAELHHFSGYDIFQD